MAIRMRNNTKSNSVCCECGQPRNKVLDMFDIKIGEHILTICDACNEALFRKTLSAECYKNSRVKSQKDMAIINDRNRQQWGAKELFESQRRKEAEAKYAVEENKEEVIKKKKANLFVEDEGED